MVVTETGCGSGGGAPVGRRRCGVIITSVFSLIATYLPLRPAAEGHQLIGAAGVGAQAADAGARSSGAGAGRPVSALVQAERRVGVGHQGGVRDDPQHPAVHADDEVVQPARVAAREQQRDRREAHQQPDQAAGEGIGLPGVRRAPGAV